MLHLTQICVWCCRTWGIALNECLPGTPGPASSLLGLNKAHKMALEWHKVAIMSSFVAFSRLCVPRQYLIAPRASFQSHPAFSVLHSASRHCSPGGRSKFLLNNVTLSCRAKWDIFRASSSRLPPIKVQPSREFPCYSTIPFRFDRVEIQVFGALSREEPRQIANNRSNQAKSSPPERVLGISGWIKVLLLGGGGGVAAPLKLGNSIRPGTYWKLGFN